MTRADVTRRLHEMAEEAAHCQRCPLYRDATQVVFGEGPANAAIMLVGEQPGDKEDIAGKPFVGPAGHVLDQALTEAGLDRAACYVTNAVKHFKHEQRGKFRLHKQPTRGEIQACRWWLDRELDRSAQTHCCPRRHCREFAEGQADRAFARAPANFGYRAVAGSRNHSSVGDFAPSRFLGKRASVSRTR